MPNPRFTALFGVHRAAALLCLLSPLFAAQSAYAISITGTSAVASLAGLNGEGGTYCQFNFDPALVIAHTTTDQVINDLDYFGIALIDSADSRVLSSGFGQVQAAFSPLASTHTQLSTLFSPPPVGPVHLVMYDLDASYTPIPGYLLDLVIPEAMIVSGPAECRALLPNRPPVADAGVDQSVGGGAMVTLDGTASSDPDNDTLSYVWQQIDGPTVTLTNAGSVQTSFVAPAATSVEQQLVFRLTVSDGSASSSADVVVRITAAVAAPPAFQAPEVIPASSLPARLLLLLGVLGMAGLFLIRPRLFA